MSHAGTTKDGRNFSLSQMTYIPGCYEKQPKCIDTHPYTISRYTRSIKKEKRPVTLTQLIISRLLEQCRKRYGPPFPIRVYIKYINSYTSTVSFRHQTYRQNSTGSGRFPAEFT